MDDDQQFCLRWNNHQSTLISVFDTLLENETLVDCTLAAEGKFLKAHKVVLSACSPYFATLLQEQYDKHPIFILKDVKYQELRAMMDYMYRGEVNISQDQLAALLKAAESLQIKGLSDNRSGSSGSGGGGSGTSGTGGILPKHDQHRGLNLPSVGGSSGKQHISGAYTLEQTKRARIGPSSIDSQDLSGSREGSSSPTTRRRRKVRRRSIENAMTDVHDNSNSSQVQANASSSLLQQSNVNLGGVSAITAAASALASQVPASTSALSGAATTSSTLATAIQGTTQQLTTAAANAIKKTESAKGATTAAVVAAAAAAAAVAAGSSSSGVSEALHSELLAHSGGANVDHQQQQQQQHGLELKSEKQNHKQHKIVTGKETTATGGGSGGSAGTELVIEPKSEFDDEGNDENVEDLTLDDEDMGMEDLDHNAGTSHGNEGSSQGYAQWQHDRSQDEVFMATQEAQQRDPQDVKYNYMAAIALGVSPTERYPCGRCTKSYLRKRHLQRHMRDECIGIPPRFSCELCPSRFRRKYHMVRHLISKHGIPAEIAQQSSGRSSHNGRGGGGSGGRSSSTAAAAAAAVAATAAAAAAAAAAAETTTTTTTTTTINKEQEGSGGDSPLPENLSIKKEHFEMDIKPVIIAPGIVADMIGGGISGVGSGDNEDGAVGGGGIGGLGNGKASGSNAINNNSKNKNNNNNNNNTNNNNNNNNTNTNNNNNNNNNNNGKKNKVATVKMSTSPVPPPSTPIYGFTGAITAISTAAAAVAAAAAASANETTDSCDEEMGATGVTAGANIDGNSTAAGGSSRDDLSTADVGDGGIQTDEGDSSNPGVPPMLTDEEWKMKFSLQLISNSLLKERLMNTMPFAYNK